MNPIFARYWPVLAAAAVAAVVAPVPVLATALLAAGLWLLTRHPAQTIVASAVSLPIGVWLIDHPGALRLGVACACAALLIWRYRADLNPGV